MCEKYKIILCSESKRRQELLKGLDFDFEIKIISGLKEEMPQDMPPDKVPESLAKQKANFYNALIDDKSLIITADTAVILNGNIYGKPTTKEVAMEMLKSLSGKTHRVITGVCLTSKYKQHLFSDISKVTFCDFSEEEIEYYVKKYEPYDKAGGYGIQEWLGFIGVEKIEGSFYNVMGLPVQKLYQALKKF